MISILLSNEEVTSTYHVGGIPDFNSKGQLHQTPLHYAINLLVQQIILDSSPSNTITTTVDTPSLVNEQDNAFQCIYLEALQLIIDSHKPSLIAQDANGHTPLHLLFYMVHQFTEASYQRLFKQIQPSSSTSSTFSPQQYRKIQNSNIFNTRHYLRLIFYLPRNMSLPTYETPPKPPETSKQSELEKAELLADALGFDISFAKLEDDISAPNVETNTSESSAIRIEIPEERKKLGLTELLDFKALASDVSYDPDEVGILEKRAQQQTSPSLQTNISFTKENDDKQFFKEYETLTTFLRSHHALRCDKNKDSAVEEDALKDEPSLSQDDYIHYIETVAGSPYAVKGCLLYSLRTDDLDIVKLLLHYVGIEFIMTNCYLLTDVEYVHQKEACEEMDKSTLEIEMESSVLKRRSIFWIAAYHGSSKVLDELATECMSFFVERSLELESETLEKVDCEQIVQKGKERLTFLLDDSSNGCTSILIASLRDNYSSVKVLIEHGSDPNGANDHGTTPAIIASSFNNIKTLDTLGSFKDVDMNKSNEAGMTSALVACQKGNIETLRFLSQYKGDGLDYLVDFRVCDKRGFGCA